LGPPALPQSNYCAITRNTPNAMYSDGSADGMNTFGCKRPKPSLYSQPARLARAYKLDSIPGETMNDSTN
jgi:hypothetical protein